MRLTPDARPVASSEDYDGSRGTGRSSLPVIERAPQRVPFPRLNGSASRGPESSSGPSSRRLAAATETTWPGSDARPSTENGETASFDRQKLLERYERARANEIAARPDTKLGRDQTPGPSQRIAGARARSSRSNGADTAPSSAGGRRGDRSDPRVSRPSASDPSGKSRPAETQRRGSRDDRTNRRDEIARVEQPKKLRELALLNPERTRAFLNRGAGLTQATEAGISVGLSATFGLPCGVGFGIWDDNWGIWWNGNGCGDLWWNGWGCGGYSYSWWCHPYSYWYWNWYGCWPYGISYWYPYSYYYSPPVYYASAIYEYTDPATTYSSAAAEAPPAYPAEAEPAVGEGVIRDGKEKPDLEALLAPRGADSLARASSHYLALGDSAFRDGRYGDAVHFYAKAVEFSPEEGVLYLVLSDALFSTGDYHYGAYALRRALELDATLLEKSVDKHSFYADALDFDRQLAVLETYLKDRPTDHDARLLLAANYVFGSRPAAAVDLLESATGTAVRESPSGKLVLAAARKFQYGAK